MVPSSPVKSRSPYSKATIISAKKEADAHSKEYSRPHSASSHSNSTPPTPLSGSGSGSTLVYTPHSVSSCSGGEHRVYSGRNTLAHSKEGSTGKGSPQVPARAQSLKTASHCSPQRRSPSYGKHQSLRETVAHTRQASDDQLDAVQLKNIDPAILEKEEMTIDSCNFLRAPSPVYDKLDGK